MKNLTEGNIYKTFILFAIPLVLSGILSQGYSLVDTIIAGKFLGDNGLAATGSVSAFLSFISSVFWGYGSGFGIYVAKLFGAGKHKEMKNAIYNNLLAIFLVAILFAIGIIAFKNPILDFLKVDGSIRPQAAIYLCVYVAGLCFIVMSNSCVYIMNAMGASSYPFYMSMIATVLNISGNILTITVLKWGVSGIALSSVFAALVVDVCYVVKLKKCFRKLGVKNHRFRFGLESFRLSFSYSVSVMIQQMIMYAAGMLLSPLINGIGSAATASYNVVTKIYDINAGIYQNSAKTLSNYTAQSIGAKKYNNLKRGVRVGLLQGILLLSPVLLICVFFAKPVCSAFFPSGYSDTALTYALAFSHGCLPFLYINIINNLFHSFFRGTGSMRLLLVSTFIGSASRLLFSAIFVPCFAMNGIYFGWILSWVVEAIFCIIVYFNGYWKRNIEGFTPSTPSETAQA